MHKRLILYIDGASRGNPGPAGIGAVIQEEDGTTKSKISSYIGQATNNQAEYTALVMGLKEAKRLGADHVEIKTDSQLLAEQIRGKYKVRHANIKPLFEEASQLLGTFRSYTVDFIPRQHNSEADTLANEALDKQKHRILHPAEKVIN